MVAGPGDGVFFGDGWYEPVDVGAVTGRYSRGPAATMFVPVFETTDTLFTFRMQACDATPAPTRNVRVTVNGNDVSMLPVVWDPEKAGSYDVPIPRAVLREGWNRVELRADGSSIIPQGEDRFVGAEKGSETSFFLLNLRVVPQSPPGPPLTG